MSKIATKVIAGLGVVAGLAMATLPLTSYVSAASDTENVTVNVDVASTITINSATTPVNIAFTAAQLGTTRTGDCTVSVSTNNSAGYKLTLSMISSDANAGALKSPNSTIAKSANTFASPAALTAGTWGYRISSFTANMYAGVPAAAAAQQIKTTSAPASADSTVVTFAARVANTQASGTYTNQVTFVATTL